MGSGVRSSEDAQGAKQSQPGRSPGAPRPLPPLVPERSEPPGLGGARQARRPRTAGRARNARGEGLCPAPGPPAPLPTPGPPRGFTHSAGKAPRPG